MIAEMERIKAKVDELFERMDLDVLLHKHFCGGFDNRKDYEKYGDSWQPIDKLEKEIDCWWADFEDIPEVVEEGSPGRGPLHGRD